MIDKDAFLEWCKDRFGEENLKFRKGGAEICTHSFFVDNHPDFPDGDHKFKLWMNPDGGKHERKDGVYRCWYTNNKGSLISLVSIVDKIPWDQAADRICSEIPLRVLEQKVHDFYNNVKGTVVEEENSNQLRIPPYCAKISDMNPTSFYCLRAMEYLNKRKIPAEGLYVCTDGDYKNRIIIPYYDKDNKLIYYNARTLSKDAHVLRYMKPKPEEANQTKVLYAKRWPKQGSKVYLTEGEFDSMTLFLAGFMSFACGGKYLSESQIELLRGYQIVLAFDSDGAGKTALMDIGGQLMASGFSNMRYIRPPKLFKDWNKLYEMRNIETLKAYIEKYEKPYDGWTNGILKAS